MPRAADAARWNDEGWDRAWARLDAGQAAPTARAAAAARPRRRTGAWLGVLALALPGLWFTGPALLAAEVLRGLDGRDGTALAARVDWAQVTPGLAQAFRDAAGQEHGPGARRFLDGLAQDMALAWQQPQARDHVLAGRALHPAALQAAHLQGPDRLALELGAGAGLPGLGLTLSMTEPWRLGWAVTGLRLDGAAAPAGTLPAAPLRPVMVAF